MNLLDQMSRELGIDKQYIINCSKRNDLYAKYFIKKKDGGTRTILHPSKELKVMQYWLCHNVFTNFPISSYSTAYQIGCSVKNNALQHKNGKYILHTDVTHFFESITRAAMKEFFKNNKDILNNLELKDSDIDLILDLVLYKGKYLVIGSVASPLISNCFMYNFDMDLSKIVHEQNMIYTRYADDIIISSSKHIDYDIIKIIDSLLKQYQLQRNKEKTYFMNKYRKRQVTGIIIDNNNNTLSLGYEKYTELKRNIYSYLIKGTGNIAECTDPQKLDQKI